MLGLNAGPKGRQHGFTTIELLIVVVIIGITAAVTLPAAGRTVSNERARRGATEIWSFLEYSFAVAARTGKPVAISYSSSTGTLTLADRASNTALRRLALQNGSAYMFQSVTFAPNSAVTIFPDGISTSAITITVMGMTNALRKTITASQAGQIRIQ